MSIVKSGFSAIGRLAALGLLAVAFLVGLVSVVYLSLQGSEIQVPEITGKSFSESESELASLGLKIKKRANRASTEAINTVIEQLPKPGDVVKTGQMIYVITSAGPGENAEKLNTLKKISEEDDSEKIEEMIDDKPKKAKSNSNSTRKKADTTRDVSANTNSNSDSNSQPSNSVKKETGASNNSGEKSNKNSQSPEKKGQPTSGAKPAPETHPKPPARR